VVGAGSGIQSTKLLAPPETGHLVEPQGSELVARAERKSACHYGARHRDGAPPRGLPGTGRNLRPSCPPAGFGPLGSLRRLAGQGQDRVTSRKRATIFTPTAWPYTCWEAALRHERLAEKGQVKGAKRVRTELWGLGPLESLTPEESDGRGAHGNSRGSMTQSGSFLSL
jgi:hypothetical protein